MLECSYRKTPPPYLSKAIVRSLSSQNISSDQLALSDTPILRRSHTRRRLSLFPHLYDLLLILGNSEVIADIQLSSFSFLFPNQFSY